jgi:hypothetical protein
MLVQDIKVQLVRPPVPVRGTAACYLPAFSACDRALALIIHEFTSLFIGPFFYCTAKTHGENESKANTK